MDKKSIIGIVIIAAIFIVWMSVSKKDRTISEEDRRYYGLLKEADSLYNIQEYEEARAAYYDAKNIRENVKILHRIIEIDSILLKEDMYKNNSGTGGSVIEKRTGVSEKESEPEVKVNRHIQNKSRQKENPGVFSDAAEGEQEFYTLENEKVIVKFASKGGRPYSVEVKEYKTFDQKPLILFDGDSTVFKLDFYYENEETREKFEVNTYNLYFKMIPVEDPNKLVMRLNGNDDKYIEYIYILDPDSYILHFDMKLVGLENAKDKNYNRTDLLYLTWGMYAPQQEKGWDNENKYTKVYYKIKGGDVKYQEASSKDSVFNNLKWISFKDQFFSSIIIADNRIEDAMVRSVSQEENSKYIRQFKSDIGFKFDREHIQNVTFSFYFGPNDYKYLKKNYEDIGLHHMVTVGKGLIRWINQGFIINIFNFLERFIGNYGIIILLMTIIIKILLLPLTYRSYLSQAKMRVLKPQIDEINKKIPKEKSMERQQATMALYKKAGVSPLGGCIPMLLQMPILFAMFRFFPSSIELRQESFLWAHDLSTYDSILNLPFNIPFYGDHVSLFTLLMTVSTILSMKFNSQSTSGTQQMPGMKGMMYVMPVMFMFILNSFSAALTYYYFLANLITFGQNYLFKYFIDEEELLKKLNQKQQQKSKKTGGKPKKGWMERMAEARGVKLPKK
jgi:YidC/Oxa1 family membrane protein insertase